LKSINNRNFDQGLIHTKCQPPRIIEQRVLRRNLFSKLAGALHCKLTTVTAPAGYGKSTTVIDWLGRMKLPVAWVSLDAGDNHPEVFWRYICLALDGVISGVSDAVSYCLSSSELIKNKTHLQILIDRLGASKGEILLTLDDFHVISAPDIWQGLTYLINYLPSQIHLILISRTDPELELAKLRLSGELLQIDPNDLRFQTDEIAQFYQVKGLLFDAKDLDRIEKYTQGWAAALVAVAMAPNDDQRGLKAEFSRSIQLIDNFLEEELFDKWPEEKQEFFLKTAILESLCGPLCDAVTGWDDSSERLRRLWSQNEFLIALDSANYWYRYHPLFQNCLRKLLAKQTAFSIAELHRKAARWYRENGLIHPAIEHFLQARQFDAALELIDSQAGLLVRRGEYPLVLSWLDQFPEDCNQNSRNILILKIRYYAENNLFGEAETCLERLREMGRGASNGPDDAAKRTNQKAALLLETYLLMCQGKMAECSARFQAAIAIDAALPFNNVVFDFNLSEISMYRCKVSLISVFKSSPQLLGSLRDSNWALIGQYAGFGPLAIGEFYYETNRPDEALPHLARAIAEAAKGESPGSYVPAMMTIARLKRSQNEMAVALETVKECERWLVQINRSHWIYSLNAFKVRLFLEDGRPEAARAWLAKTKLQIYQEITKTCEYELLVFARVLMAEKRFAEVEILLHRLLIFAEKENRLHSKVEILNLLALTAAQTDDFPKAMELLEQALTIGLQEGYFRSFTDESSPMAELLELYRKRRKTVKIARCRNLLLDYAADLLTAIYNSPFKTAFMVKEQSAVGVRIKCFGSFSIYRNEYPVVCKNSKAREILAYLVHNQGNAVDWERIVDVIWPDCQFEKAHVNFNSTMYLLRKFLNDHSMLEILDCSRGNYRIRPEKIYCDMYEFSRIVTELDHTPAADGKLSEAARQLYNGGYFEEDGFGWAYARAAKLEAMYWDLQNEKKVNC
jgi:LuxR family maltose regulon positive regulatory protein